VIDTAPLIVAPLCAVIAKGDAFVTAGEVKVPTYDTVLPVDIM